MNPAARGRALNQILEPEPQENRVFKLHRPVPRIRKSNRLLGPMEGSGKGLGPEYCTPKHNIRTQPLGAVLSNG